MSDNDDEAKLFSLMDDGAKLQYLFNQNRNVLDQIGGFKKWLLNAAYGGLGILFFQALPWLQAISKAVKP